MKFQIGASAEATEWRTQLLTLIVLGGGNLHHATQTLVKSARVHTLIRLLK